MGTHAHGPVRPRRLARKRKALWTDSGADDLERLDLRFRLTLCQNQGQRACRQSCNKSISEHAFTPCVVKLVKRMRGMPLIPVRSLPGGEADWRAVPPDIEPHRQSITSCPTDPTLIASHRGRDLTLWGLPFA